MALIRENPGKKMVKKSIKKAHQMQASFLTIGFPLLRPYSTHVSEGGTLGGG